MKEKGQKLIPVVRKMSPEEVAEAKKVSGNLEPMVRPLSKEEINELKTKSGRLEPMVVPIAKREKQKIDMTSKRIQKDQMNLEPMVTPVCLDDIEQKIGYEKQEEMEEKHTFAETISSGAIARKKDEEDIVEENYGNFSINIERKVITIEEMEEDFKIRTLYMVEICVEGRDIFRISIPAEHIYNVNWVTQKTGGAAYFNILNTKAREEVVKILNREISQRAFVQETRFKQNGWKMIEGKWKFVIDAGVIGERNRNIYGNSHYTFAFDRKQIGKLQTFEQAMGMLDVCYDKTVSVPLFLFAHSGVLAKLYELAGVPIKGLLALIGTTNAGKTSLGLCMTKMYNRENISSPEITFDSTPGGIEVQSSLCADAVLLVDDYHPSSTKMAENRLNDKLEMLLRRYGDRVIKKRMTDFSAKEAKTYPVKGICLITGEDIAGVQSSLTRVWTLDMNKDTVDFKRLTYYQENYKIMTTHLYDFIAYITEHFDDILQFIGENVQKIRTEKRYDVPRFSEYFAQFMTTADLIGQYAIQRGFWDYSTWNKWMSYVESILEAVVGKNLRSVRMEDFGVLALSALKDAIEQRGVIDIKDLKSERPHTYQIVTDTEFYYVDAKYLLEITKKYAARFGKISPFHTVLQLTTFLENLGVIVTKNEGKEHRRTLPFPGYKKRVLYICKDKMNEILNGATV